MPPAATPLGLVPDDPVFLIALAGMLLLGFFVYLMIRRTILGFKEGVDGGRDTRKR